VSKVDLRLQCGMPCSKLEVSTVQQGTLSGVGYLHQSPVNQPEGLAYWKAAANARQHLMRRRVEFDFGTLLFLARL
jgi:hypothetical protein